MARLDALDGNGRVFDELCDKLPESSTDMVLWPSENIPVLIGGNSTRPCYCSTDAKNGQAREVSDLPITVSQPSGPYLF
jgi:hypothetical protein